jgi:hypothetical protein
MSRFSLVVACAAIACLPAIGLATTYTDEDAWRAAVGNVYALETFDALPAYSDVTQLPALGISFDPLDDGTQPTVQPYDQTGGEVKSAPNNLLNDRDYTLPGRGPFNMRPILANEYFYGLGLWNVGGDDQLRLTFYDANDQIIEQVISAQSKGFFGIVNPVGSRHAEVDFVGGNGYAPVDDLQTAVRGTFIPNPVVPEPVTVCSVFAGLATLGAYLRRRMA